MTATVNLISAREGSIVMGPALYARQVRLWGGLGKGGRLGVESPQTGR